MSVAGGGGWRLVVPAVAALAGFLFAVSAHAAGGGDLRSGRVQDLPGLVASEQRRVATLEERAAALRTQVSALTTQGSGAQAQQAELARLGPAYGDSAVRGPGISVMLDDAPHAAGQPLPPGATPDDLVVHQQDVQAVVNALWRGGAEAMTIMDRRVTALTAVRCVGSTVLFQGHVFSPPYRVAAVGDPARLRAALDDDAAVLVFREYVAAYRLGFAVAAAADLTLPAAGPPPPLQAARPERR